MSGSGTSGPGAVTLAWHGGKDQFRLAAYGELRALQEICKAGPMDVAARLIGNAWRVEDVREVIRLGLVGGGMDAATAQAKVEASVDNTGRWLEHRALARTIILAGLTVTDEDDLPPKKPGAEETANETATAGLSSPPFTALAQP